VPLIAKCSILEQIVEETEQELVKSGSAGKQPLKISHFQIAKPCSKVCC